MMKALILKDFYMMLKQLKVYLAVMLIYAVIFVPQGMVDMIAFMTVMFSVMFVMTSMSFDETLKWDRYALCGPLRRRDVVLSKYLFSLIVVLAGLLVGMLSYLLLPLFVPTSRPLAESLVALCSACLSGLLIVAIIMPIMYKLGVEKGRLMLMGVMAVPFLIIFVFGKYAPPELSLFLLNYAIYFPAVLLLLAIIALIVSYKISLRIYNNKDF